MKGMRWADAATYAVLSIGAACVALPFLWLLSTSLKTRQQIFRFPPEWVPEPFVWENYVVALTYQGLPFARFFANSAFVTVVATIGAVASSALVAFAFSRLGWRGRDALFVVVLVTMIFPKEITIIPEFVLFRSFGWLDTFLPLIAPAYFGQPFFIFLLRQYMLTISPEMDQAAAIDGCGPWRTFRHIVLPQCAPALMTVGIFSIQGHWNDFLGPLVFLNSIEHFTMNLGLSMFSGQYGTEWGYLMAASTLAMLPILVLFAVAQKYYIAGIVVTGVK